METSSYTNFDDFKSRLAQLLNSSEAIIDCDFYTRVGLRYVDAIPIDDGQIEGWIRPELVEPLLSGTYGSVDIFRQQVRGTFESGQYTFRREYY